MPHPSALLAFALLALSQDPAPSTWILQLEGDVQTLTLTGATPKPAPFRAPRSTSVYRVRLLDARGVELANVPLDLSGYCLDPTHRDQPPHVEGDVTREHKIGCVVKVPALATVATLQIEDATDPVKPVRLGSIDKQALDTLLAAAAKEAGK